MIKAILFGALGGLFVYALSRRRLGVIPGVIVGVIVFAAWIVGSVQHG